MIPPEIHLKNRHLPDAPGVYFYYDRAGRLLYIGKATSLKRRVGSYFVKAHDDRIGEMVAQIRKIDYIETPTVIEALVLEANQIKAHQPKYNILQRDDKTFLYLVITNEAFPRPVLMRGRELQQMGVDPLKRKGDKGKQRAQRDWGGKFLRVFGPYTSSRSLKMALDLIRRSIPWSDCQPPGVTGRHRPCFNAQIGKCPGVCSGTISKTAYRRVIRQLILFFDGKKARLERELKKDMARAAKELRFEEAAALHRRLTALTHIQDIALISREDHELPFTQERTEGSINLHGRIEAYDISNISGTSAVGSMVVFVEGKPVKALYRKFKIKTVMGVNDVACMEEVMRRRLQRGQRAQRGWELPELMVIDGGEPQVNRVQEVLDALGVTVPIIGIAKGFDRKQDRLVYDHSNQELQRVVTRGKELFQRARDEAHRFAVKYHRTLRTRHSIR
ncbi:GIY-YIG nuclease family protein [Candidatus Uhrbacteria bacterium]|nr:GIY-YIG nuclease family protein [Candidatus Uhrbacteria bacterium]